MRYRRADVKGGMYFFTFNLAERKRTVLVYHIESSADGNEKGEGCALMSD